MISYLKETDKVNQYRQIICQFFQDFATDDPEAKLIFDRERDRYPCNARRLAQ